MNIPTEQIAIVDRARIDMGNIEELAEKIKANGQIQAGVVRRATQDDVEKHGVDLTATPYILVAGGRRLIACITAGLPYKAEDFGELSPLQQKVLELEENLGRKDLSWSEEVKLKAEIHKLRSEQAAVSGSTWTQRDLASELKETPANTSRDLALAKALEENPSLAIAPSKISAVRQVEYQRKIEARTAAVSQTSLHGAKSKLVTADMRDFIRTLATDSVDLCFTDFPFGIEYNFDPDDANKYEDSQGSLQDLLTDIIPEIVRVVKPSGWLCLMMGSTNYDYLADLVRSVCATHYDYFDGWYEQKPSGDWEWNMKAQCRSTPKDGSTCRHVAPEDPEWLWFRPNSRNPSMHPELHAQNQYEKFCVVNMGDAVLLRRNLGNVLVHDAVYEDRIHEMQRPPALCEDVIQRFTVGGERVLDLCFGSGQHLASAAKLERDFVGCDLNPKNLDPALMLVAEHIDRRNK